MCCPGMAEPKEVTVRASGSSQRATEHAQDPGGGGGVGAERDELLQS